MANFIFDAAKHSILDRDSTFGLETDGSGQSEEETADDVAVILVTQALSAATHGAVATLAALEALSTSSEVLNATSGYGTGGKVVTNCKWAASTGSGFTHAGSFGYLYGDDVTWTNLGASTDLKIVGAVLYYSTDGILDSDADDIPVAYYDFEAQADGSNLVLQWAGVGGAASPSGGQGVLLKMA